MINCEKTIFVKAFSVCLSCLTYVSREFCYLLLWNDKKSIVNYNMTLNMKKSSKNRVGDAAILKNEEATKKN